MGCSCMTYVSFEAFCPCVFLLASPFPVLQGTMLRCAAVAQREAARQRREATANFTGVFATEVRVRMLLQRMPISVPV